MATVINIYDIKKRKMVLTEELLDDLGEEYQKREECFEKMTFEQFVHHRLWQMENR